MIDVQSEVSKIKIDIDKVGVKNIRKEFIIPKDGLYFFLSSINCYVDLPSKYRGIHMSRNIEAINETISDVSRKPVRTLEEFAENSDRVDEYILEDFLSYYAKKFGIRYVKLEKEPLSLKYPWDVFNYMNFLFDKKIAKRS